MRQVQHSSEGVQLYKKGDDYSVVQEVKGSPDLSGDLSQSGSEISSSKVTTEVGDSKQTESHRSVTVVQNVSSSTAKQERIIDLMLSGPPRQEHPSEELVDVFSTPASDIGINDNILQASMDQTTPLTPASDNAPLIPDLMGDTISDNTKGTSSDVLIPDLLGGDTSITVEESANLSVEGSRFTWNVDIGMEGVGDTATSVEGQVS